MAPTRRTICIAGAGIAGMTLAIALARHGVASIVLERNDTIQEFGAGLQISPNARRALNALGLNEALNSVSFEPEGIDVYSFGSKRPLTTLALGAAMRDAHEVPYAVMHRADLAEVLHSACTGSELIEMQFGVEQFSADNRDGDPLIRFTSAGGETREISCAALIGADGVGSQVRSVILGRGEASYSGYVAWRTLIDIPALADVLRSDRTGLVWGPGFHAVAYPLPHRGKFNIALFTRERLSVAFGLHEKPNLPPKAARDPRIARFIESAEDWTHWPLATVESETWHSGNVGLIGDAAHAMLPFQAQGAAMAIEDALVLAPLLADAGDMETAFQDFQEIRRERVARVAAISKANGWTFHLPAPLSQGRDLVVRTQGPRAHLRRLDWIYSYDPARLQRA